MMCCHVAFQQENGIKKKEAMEDAVGAAVLGSSNVGDNYTIPYGVNNEMQLRRDTQERLKNAEMTTSDGDVRLKLIGKFQGCAGAVDLQVS